MNEVARNYGDAAGFLRESQACFEEKHEQNPGQRKRILLVVRLCTHARACPRTRDRPRLVFLPIGSPHLNPIEPIWKSLKWESSRLTLTLIVEGAAEYCALLNEIFIKLTDQLSFAGSWIENHLDEFIQRLR